MSIASVVTGVMESSPCLFRMTLSLLWINLAIGRRVSKTRKAFENQLIQQGMSKEDAKRLSGCFEDLKNNITGMLKQGIRLGGP